MMTMMTTVLRTVVLRSMRSAPAGRRGQEAREARARGKGEGLEGGERATALAPITQPRWCLE